MWYRSLAHNAMDSISPADGSSESPAQSTFFAFSRRAPGLAYHEDPNGTPCYKNTKIHHALCLAVKHQLPPPHLSQGPRSRPLFSLTFPAHVQVGLRKPVFSSPMAANYLTTGRWSPTRPGMLFLGKVDGSMDVWDFTDSSFTPSVTLMSSPSRITR